MSGIQPPTCVCGNAVRDSDGFCLDCKRVNSSKPDKVDFKLGDKVRVKAAWLDRKGDVYEVDVITPTAVRAFNGDTVLTLRKEKWVHA